MSERNGKIARLSRALQNEVNQRLDKNEPGETLLEWLNAQPEIHTLLSAEFAGVPVSKQNLSQWRLGGFREWQLRQEVAADARELSTQARELESVQPTRLADSLATVLAGRYASLLRHWTGEVNPELEQSLRILRGMIQDVAHLRRWDHSAERVRLEQVEFESRQEMLPEALIEVFEKWARRPEVKDWLVQSWVPPEERARRKRELFGLPPLPEEAPAKTPVASAPPVDPPSPGTQSKSVKASQSAPAPIPGVGTACPPNATTPDAPSDDQPPSGRPSVPLPSIPVHGGERWGEAALIKNVPLSSPAATACKASVQNPVQSPEPKAQSPAPTPEPPEKSPHPPVCPGHCEPSGHNFCRKCGLTPADIHNWPSRSEEMRRDILFRARERRRGRLC